MDFDITKYLIAMGVIIVIVIIIAVRRSRRQ